MTLSRETVKRWLVWLGVVTLLSVLFVNAQVTSPKQHALLVAQLHQLGRLDATLNQEFLKENSGLLNHFDSLVDLSRQIDALQIELTASFGALELTDVVAITEAREQVNTVFTQKEMLLEHLKSEVVVLRNSLRFLPIASKQIQSILLRAKEGGVLRELINNLERHTLAYSLTGDVYHRLLLEEALARLTKIQAQWSPALGERIDNFMGHVGVVMQKKTSIESMLQRFFSLPTQGALDALSARYQDNYEECLARTGLYRFGLYFFSILLMVYVSFVLFKLRRSVTALGMAQSELSSIIENTVDAIITIDVAGNIVHFNNAAESMFAYSAAEVVGKNVEMLLPEQYRQRHTRGLEIYLSSGKSTIIGKNVTLAGLRKDGSLFPIDLAVNELWVEGQRMFTAIVRDISERVTSEKEMAHYRGELENIVKSRTVELQRSNKELEAYSYSIAHDLRAPLRTITSFSQIIQEEAGNKLNTEEMGYFGRIIIASKRMAELIDDILRLSRITREDVSLKAVDFSQLAEEARERICMVDKERKIDWHIQSGLMVVADRRLLAMLLDNLLGNAHKYTAKTLQASIEFGCKSHQGTTHYFVRDNGAGFDMKYADRLFSPFHRLHGHDDFEGSGIGLATVQRIVERHNGRVWADSEVNKGATFYFTLSSSSEV
jgi:PAS domain S-box-containing protein